NHGTALLEVDGRPAGALAEIGGGDAAPVGSGDAGVHAPARRHFEARSADRPDQRAPSPRRPRRRRSHCAASVLPSIGSPPQSFPQSLFVVLLLPLKPGRKIGILFCPCRVLRIETKAPCRGAPARGSSLSGTTWRG